MENQFVQIGNDLVALAQLHAKELGLELKQDLQGVAEFAAERAMHLSQIVDEPGFSEALEAERDAVTMRMASAAIDRADAVDARFQTFVQQALQLGARALAVAVA